MIVRKGLFSDRIDTYSDEASLMREYYRSGMLETVGVDVIDLSTGKQHRFWDIADKLEKRLKK